ncbi:hypothetical protein D3C80_867530 [compost metagenome]
MAASVGRRGLRKMPGAFQYVCMRFVKSHHVVPPRSDRQAIDDSVIATAELHGDAAIALAFCGQVVKGVDILRVAFKITGRIIDTDGPESVHRHVFGRQFIMGGSIISCRRYSQVKSVLRGVSAPGRRTSDEMANRIDLCGFAVHPPRIRNCRSQRQQ